MSVSIKVSWACECPPSTTTGWIDGDTDTIYCNKCSGVIQGTDNLTLAELRKYVDSFNKEHGLAL